MSTGSADISNSRNDISGHPETAYDMVYGDMADYDTKVRGECGGGCGKRWV
jgi:hypothetical protein